MTNTNWKQIPLRDIFPNEAHDFTPWLEKNVDILNEVVNDHLLPYRREQRIGDLQADLLLTNESKNKLFLLENQFGISDHDHFGKCLTYSYMIHPDQTLWIAEQFSTSHILILNQLNISLTLVQFTLESNENLLRVHIVAESKSKRIVYVRIIGKVGKPKDTYMR